jgi:hypothetical protein
LKEVDNLCEAEDKAEKLLRTYHDSFTLVCAEMGRGRLVFEQHLRASLHRCKCGYFKCKLV